jgi:hypothetical protein
VAVTATDGGSTATAVSILTSTSRPCGRRRRSPARRPHRPPVG